MFFARASNWVKDATSYIFSEFIEDISEKLEHIKQRK